MVLLSATRLWHHIQVVLTSRAQAVLILAVVIAVAAGFVGNVGAAAFVARWGVDCNVEKKIKVITVHHLSIVSQFGGPKSSFSCQGCHLKCEALQGVHDGLCSSYRSIGRRRK